MMLEHLAGRFDRLPNEVPIALEIGEAQQRLAALALAQVFARAAQLEIALRDLEAIRALEDHLQPGSRAVGQWLAIEQDADALARAAADPPAQLMELREPEALRALDHHQRSIRHVYADFDHGGADEEVSSASDKIRHHRRLLRGRESPVQQADPQAVQF